VANPLNDLPLAEILTIIPAPARNNLTNISEQWLQVGRQRVSRLMQPPHQLIEIVSQANQLHVNQSVRIIRLAAAGRRRAVCTENSNADVMMAKPADDWV
jgi:hypothetical protein